MSVGRCLNFYHFLISSKALVLPALEAPTQTDLSAGPDWAQEKSIKQVLAENPTLPVMGMLWLSTDHRLRKTVWNIQHYIFYYMSVCVTHFLS